MLNFARGEIVDGAALQELYKNGHKGKYICDFADEFMQNHEHFMCIPHLGASTEEAEDNCAAMAANQVRATSLPRKRERVLPLLLSTRSLLALHPRSSRPPPALFSTSTRRLPRELQPTSPRICRARR